MLHAQIIPFHQYKLTSNLGYKTYSLLATGTHAPHGDFMLLCFLMPQNEDYQQKKVCKKSEAQHPFIALFVYHDLI